MQIARARAILLVVLSGCLPAAMALDPEACQERLKSVDDRIASGKYSAQNVQMAQEMRDSIMQSCALLDEATVGQMLEGFEYLLPTKSEAERQADDDARRAERSEKRDAQRAELELKRAERAERERREALVEKPSVSEVLKRPPTAKSTFGEFIDRDDGMFYVEIEDWDTQEGKVRVLYSTSPSHLQLRSPDKKTHVYVIEADAKGGVKQYHVTASETLGLLAAGLRRGHDEVVLQWTQPGNDVPPKLEQWDISDQELLSTASSPALYRGRYDQFSLCTSDGNVLFDSSHTRSNGISSVSWLKVSPDGKEVGRGVHESGANNQMTQDWFHTSNGGGGFVTLELAKTEVGIDSELAPIVRRIGSGEIKAVVASETRLLVTNGGAIPAWESPAISRTFVWLGLPEVSRTLSMEERMEMTRIVMEAERDNGGTVSLANDSVTPIGEGYGVLIGNSYRNKEQSPVYGDWLYEYGTDGEVRKTYLNPAAEQLGVDFSMIAAPDEGAVFLYAGAQAGTQPYVVLLDENRQVAAYGKALIGQKTATGGIIADKGGVWVLGNGQTDDGLQHLWLERIDF
ncbi:MAG: hypothetical protein WBM88_01795 [Woeseiaceae bacterium]